MQHERSAQQLVDGKNSETSVVSGPPGREDTVKGVNGTLVEEVVRAERGDDRWDEIVDDAGGPGADTSLGSHVDSDLVDLAETVATHVGPRCGQRVRVEQPLRRHRSDVVCVLRVTCS